MNYIDIEPEIPILWIILSSPSSSSPRAWCPTLSTSPVTSSRPSRPLMTFYWRSTWKGKSNLIDCIELQFKMWTMTKSKVPPPVCSACPSPTSGTRTCAWLTGSWPASATSRGWARSPSVWRTTRWAGLDSDDNDHSNNDDAQVAMAADVICDNLEVAYDWARGNIR